MSPQDQNSAAPHPDTELLRRRARALASPLPAPQAYGPRQDLLAFSLGGDRFGLDATFVREIVRVGEESALPMMPPCVLGIMSVRGRLVALIDLAVLLGLRELRIGDRAHVVICAGDGREFGFLVGHVDLIRRAPAGEIHPGLATLTDARARCTAGVTEDCLVVLDGRAIMREAERAIEGEESREHNPRREGDTQ